MLFVVAPLAAMTFQCNLHSLIETSTNPEVLRSIQLTILTSLAASIVGAVVAVPFAWLLARKTFILKPLVLSLMDLPVVVPHSTAGIALLSVANRDTPLGRLAERLGFSIVENPVGITMAMAFVSLPFLINAARTGFESIPARVEQVALTLGASHLRVFFTISVPLAWRSILSGLAMMFARGLSEFGAVIIISYHPAITPVLIYDWLSCYGLHHARNVAVLFLTVSLAIFVCLRLLGGGRSNARS